MHTVTTLAGTVTVGGLFAATSPANAVVYTFTEISVPDSKT
jgi:hypothetical protein